MSVKVRPYKRGGWEVDIRCMLPDGTEIRERKKSRVSSKQGSVRWGRARESELLVQQQPKPRKEVPTLARFASRFLEHHCRANRQKASGIQRKESILRVHLKPMLGRKRLDEISNEDVQRLKRKLKRKAPSTVNNILTVLSKLLKVAVEWRVIDTLPCTIKLLPRPQAEADYWDFHEFDRLVEKGTDGSPNARLVVLLGGQAGLRMGEMIALRWEDVDLERRHLRVQQNDWRGHLDTPKGGRRGVVDLCDRLASALREHQAHSRLRSKDGRVLCREDGSPLTERIVRRLVERAEHLAGLPHKGVHALRHTFGAHLAMRGAPQKAIQELMRHADLSMTQRYTHLSPAARQSAVRLLDEKAPPVGDIVETGEAGFGSL